jgi:glyoxylase-like metal-dependent hydrolase (beta-lactamase superfamily II)
MGANVFILETEDALYLIDTGYPGFEKAIMKKIRSFKKDLKLILLTHSHYDHFGCVMPIKEQTGALVAIHQNDSADLCNGTTALDSVSITGMFEKMILPLAELVQHPKVTCPDIVLHDGDSLHRYGLDAIAVHTPGHTKGSTTFIVQDSIAFVGDLIINFPHFRKQPYFANSWSEIDSSVIKLLNYNISFVYTGHRKKTGDRETIKEIAGNIRKKQQNQ